MNVLAQKFTDDQVQAESLNPTTYAPDLDRLAAYRLLAHAELEEFIESKAKEGLISVLAQLQAGAKLKDNCSILLPIAMILKKPLLDSDKVDSIRLNEYLIGVVAAAQRAVGENNSIKSNAFLLLSLCAGKELEDIDTTLSSIMNSFGRDRGDVAHKSTPRCQSINSPSTEVRNVASIMSQLAIYYDVTP